MPKWSEPTSDQLHFVVELSSGIRDKTGPVERLKEALSSKIAFQKYYLVSFFYYCIYVIYNIIFKMIGKILSLLFTTYRNCLNLPSVPTNTLVESDLLEWLGWN